VLNPAIQFEKAIIMIANVNTGYSTIQFEKSIKMVAKVSSA
jgi:hypothetical protein